MIFSQNCSKKTTQILLGLLTSLLFFTLLGCGKSEDKSGGGSLDGDNRRIEDLNKVKAALEAYYKDNSSYPSTGGKWDGYKSAWGNSKKEWISGIIPKYLSELPRDPRMDEDPAHQYLYNSNGKDYKLIAHSPENCFGLKSKYPTMADPVRDCWAIGFWTEGGRIF